jgi:hypothetical protein
MKVRIVNRARDARWMLVVRCVAAVSNGGRCAYDGRWLFSLDDGETVRVCRLHANAGERRGELEVRR